MTRVAIDAPGTDLTVAEAAAAFPPERVLQRLGSTPGDDSNGSKGQC